MMGNAGFISSTVLVCTGIYGVSGCLGIAGQAAKSSARSSTTTSMLFVAGEGAELRIQEYLDPQSM